MNLIFVGYGLAFLALAATLGLWLVHRKSAAASGQAHWLRRWAVPAMVVGLVVGGLWSAEWFAHQVDTKQRAELLAQATAVARTINLEGVETLSFQSEDAAKPEYRRLCDQMMAYRQRGGVRGLYTMVLRDHRLVFGPESYATNDPQASLPGTVYQKPPTEAAEVFSSHRARTFGPYQDEFGAFVSGWAPVLNPRTGHVMLVVGVDMDAKNWQAAIARARLAAILVSLACLMVLLSGDALLNWRRRLPVEHQWRLRHLEAGLCAVAGVAITLSATWRMLDAERQARRETFSTLARAQGEGFAESLRDLRTQLDAVSRIFEGGRRIERGEFHNYVEPLVHGGLAQAWEWIPAVPPNAVAGLQNQAHQEGVTDFALYQKDSQGRRAPISARKVYYPVLYAEPRVGNEKAFGYDLGSEPARRAALLEAARSGLPVATDPITLVQETGVEQGLLVFHPVFDGTTPQRQLRGFALVVLRLESALRQFLRQSGNEELGVAMALSELVPGHAPRFLAGTASDSTPQPGGRPRLRPADGRPSVDLPLFLFGKSYLVQVRAEQSYLSAHPLWQGWVAGLGGLLLTAMLTGFVGGLANRRAALEREVQLRTSQLGASEARLRENTSRLQLLWQALEQSPVSIVITDTHGAIQYVNPKFTEGTGYSREEALGQNPRILKSGKQPASVYAELWSSLTAGQSWRGEFCNRRKNGDLYWESAVICPVQDEQGTITNYLAIKEDITERKRANAALEITNQQLELATARANEMAVQAALASAAKSEFLANMSHEIRTPMNGVIGMTGLLLATDLTDTQRRYAQTVRASGQTLLQLINDILDFSKIEAGKFELETLDFDLRSVLDEFTGIMAVKAAEKNLEFLCAAAPNVPGLLRGDPGRLQQVLTNLAGNALKFTHRGEVAVRVGLESESDGKACLRFSVRDTGIGIHADKLGILFQKFTQVDGSITRQYGGTGLGLAISKQLVEMMGGEIGVKSQEGKGSEFWFTVLLPLQPEPQHEQSAKPQVRGARVLVVDDNATHREILRVQLAAWGMLPSEVADGPTALQFLREALEAGDPFRVALVDAQMPGMDGDTLSRAIRAEARLNDTALIMMTSLGQRDDAGRLEQVGMAACLVKPVRQTELLDCLVATLTGGSGSGKARGRAARSSAPRRLRRGARILLAEDNVTNQQVAVAILKQLGFQADVAVNGQAALQALASTPYDLVLMDVQMPVMGGLEATRRIRDHQSPIANHDIPIVAMTARALAQDRAECAEAGMNDFIPKPVEPKVLAKVLEKWLPEQPSDTAAGARPSSGAANPTAVEASETFEGRSPADVAAPGDGRRRDRARLGHSEPEPAPALASDSSARERTSDVAAPGDGRGPTTAVYDRAAFLARMMDDETMMRAVQETFVQDMPTQIEALRGHVTRGEPKEAGELAHRIKGAAATVGGQALREVAAVMEAAGKQGDHAFLENRLAELEEQFRRLKQAMEVS